jgi:3-hydroxyacyl-[acyl-carrier-protein] dehydratase
MNVVEIQAKLPHRYPFLLVDRVVEIVPGESIHAIKNVTANEPHFQGHFPQSPIMPGVLLVEAVAQAAGLLALAAPPAASGEVFYLTGLDGFRFRKVVVPGDVVHIHVTKTAAKRGVWKFATRCEVDGRLVVEGELTAAMSNR